MAKYRVTNVTHLIPGQAGFFLNFHGVLLQCGKPMLVDIDHLQKMKKNENATVDANMLFEWANKGWIKIKNPETGDPIVDDIGDMDRETSPRGPRLSEAADSTFKEDTAMDFEDDFDPLLAKEAELPVRASQHVAEGAHVPPTNQVHGARASINFVGEDNRETDNNHSPIPGSKPVSVDDSDKFTVRAPRSNAPGGVIKN